MQKYYRNVFGSVISFNLILVINTYFLLQLTTCVVDFVCFYFCLVFFFFLEDKETQILLM